MIDSTIFKSSSPKRRLRVFLCHASEDKKKVQEIYRRLQSEGLDVWFDSESLLPGQDWQSEIAKAVRSSDAVIVFLSSHSISKVGYVQKEIRFALDVADEQPENAIFLIPARLEDCQVPDRLCRWQWVNFFEKKGYSRLLEALSARASALGISMIHQGFFPFPSGWFSTKLDGYRECENTYCFFPYESLPPLDEETFQGDFKWLSIQVSES